MRFSAKNLTKEEATAEISRLVTDCRDLAGLEEILLFGSASREEMTEASDLDAVLIFENLEQAKAASKVVHSRRTSRWPADLLCVDRAQFESKSTVGGVLFIARNEGQSIFRKQKP